MRQDRLRNGVLAVALLLFFSATSVAAVSPHDDIAKKFAQAESLVAKGEIEQAISAYSSLIQLNPLLPEAYNNLAALYLRQKKSKQAKAILEQGIYAHKGYAALYESLTAINVAMAREAYSKALQIDLKPAAIAIASLSLNDTYSNRKKSTIVISKATEPVSTKKVAVKTVVENNTLSKTKASGEIKRENVVSQASQSSTKQPGNTDEIETTLQAWSAAWSAQAVDIYLSFYHRYFKSSDGLSRNGWEQSRRLKLKKPHWIKVAITDIKLEKNDGRQAIVKFKQIYKSNSYSDDSIKRLVLLYTKDGWRIFQEKSI